MTNAKRILVIGYGNEGRCDDGLGPAVAAALAELDLPGLTVESAYQLNVEDAATVAEHDVVLFADASVNGKEPFELQQIEPSDSSAEFTTHSVSPSGVLALAHGVFGGATLGYTIGIRGYRFHEFGEELSEGARSNLATALTFIRAALEPGRVFEQTSSPLPEGRST
jgi:hydrogenase maturation protease